MSRRGLVSARRATANVAQTITVDGIAALTTAGLTVQNTTEALVGAQVQRAPSVWQYGTGWDSDDAVSRVFGMGWQMRPVAGNTVSGGMHLMHDLAGVVADTGIVFTSAGMLEMTAPGSQSVATAGAIRFRTNAGPVMSARNSANTQNINFAECLNNTWYLGSSQVTGGFVIEAGTLGSPTALQLENVNVVRLTDSNTAQTLWMRGRSALSANANGSPFQLSGGAPNGSGTPGELKLGWDNSAAAFQENLRLGSDGSAAMTGFFGATPAVKPTVTGSRGGNAALADLLTELATLGLLTDSSSA